MDVSYINKTRFIEPCEMNITSTKKDRPASLSFAFVFNNFCYGELSKRNANKTF